MVVYFTMWKGQNMDSTFISFYTTLMCPNLVLNPKKRKDASILGRETYLGFC